jgi:glycosyltransferase involved in cell wall biosynthesis
VDPEVSVVLPCMNEAETLEACIARAQEALREAGIDGEIVVADSSTDESPAIAGRMGARVVRVEERGYGNALMQGIAQARGRYIVMGDADLSCDFGEVPRFVEKLREGYDLVQGCRLPSGGGRVLPRAMPLLHRFLGNPLFSFVARWWFGARIHDINCGYRGFTAELHRRLGQRCTGMEFASEMIIKASLMRARVTEIPVTLHPDGRTIHPPHLRTFRDGWRTLRFYLMYSPRWLFFVPGGALALVGLAGLAVVLSGSVPVDLRHGVSSLLLSCLAILIGFQAIWLGFFTHTFAIEEGLVPRDPAYARIFEVINLERGLIAGAVATVAGAALVAAGWFGRPAETTAAADYLPVIQYMVPGTTLVALGVQTVLSSFFASILGVRRK